MCPSESPVKDLDVKHVDIIGKFVSDIRNKKLQGSNNIALAAVTFLDQIISESETTTAFELCCVVREVGRRVSRALPHEPVAANMVRRVLRAIRDENRAHANQSGEGATESLQRLVLGAAARRGTLGAPARDLREPIRDHIAELRAELESSTAAVCSQARSLVQGAELVLTYGAGRLAERFLRAAALARFRLLLAEGPSVAQSHAMAARLSAAGVPVTVVSAAAVYGVMSRVNKVVVQVRAALGAGAVLGEAGLHAVTSAARHYSVPVLALAPLYKLCPLHACDPQHSGSLASPIRTLPYEECASDAAAPHVYAPLYDLVPPDHITLFITNLGGSSPSYIYRLLSELYDPNDYQF